MQVSNTVPRAVVVARAAAPATNATPVQTPKPSAPAMVVAKPQGLSHAAKSAIWGGLGSGAVGTIAGAGCALFHALAAGGISGGVVALWVGGAAVVIGGLGAAASYFWGKEEQKIIDRDGGTKGSNWGLYIAATSLLSTAGPLLHGAAVGMNGALTGLGSGAVAAYRTVKEVHDLGAERGGQVWDNKVRLGGAAAATVGGFAATAALIPAVAAAAPWLVPVGVGVAAVGWAANLVGHWMDDKRA
ncbi:MAG: hypothetical protein JWM80_3950 [Cyanobacteria bacterium RYN_339]|nr:hypothetical protein [Cyanobacteria bacterium RYN_339]